MTWVTENLHEHSPEDLGGTHWANSPLWSGDNTDYPTTGEGSSEASTNPGPATRFTMTTS